jgi:putative ABC transport system permease protein
MLGKYIGRDIKHRSGKFIFLVLSVSIGIAAIIGILQINVSAQNDLNQQLENFGANLVIYPKSDAFSLQYGGVNLASVDVKQSEINEDDIEKIYMIENAENINILSPKAVGAVYLGDDLVPLVGVDFEAEIDLKKWWVIIGDVPELGEALIGNSIHDKLGIDLGQAVEFNDQIFKVSGLLNNTGSQDDDVIFVGLNDAQKVLGKEGKISLIEIMAFCNTCPIDEIIRQIEEALPNVKGVAARQLINTQMTFTQKFLEFGFAVSIFILLIGIISLSTSMVSFVKDKTKEIGIMRAVGFRKKDVGRIIVFEVVIIAVLSGLIGFGVGHVIATLLGQTMLGLSIGIDMMMLLWAFAISLLVCSLSVLLPMRTASKITVTEALRSL